MHDPTRDQTVRNVTQAFASVEYLQLRTAYIRSEGNALSDAVWQFYEANRDNWQSIPGSAALMAARFRWDTQDAGNFYPVPEASQ